MPNSNEIPEKIKSICLRLEQIASGNSGEFRKMDLELLRKYSLELYELSFENQEENTKSKSSKEYYVPADLHPPIAEEILSSEEEKIIEHIEKDELHLNQKISEADPIEKTEKEEMILNQKVSAEPVAKTENPVQNHLKSYISLNNKIAFQKSLFGGNQLDYDKALDELSSAKSHADAEVILERIKSERNWDPKNDLVKEFSGILKRKQ